MIFVSRGYDALTNIWQTLLETHSFWYEVLLFIPLSPVMFWKWYPQEMYQVSNKLCKGYIQFIFFLIQIILWSIFVSTTANFINSYIEMTDKCSSAIPTLFLYNELSCNEVSIERCSKDHENNWRWRNVLN